VHAFEETDHLARRIREVHVEVRAAPEKLNLLERPRAAPGEGELVRGCHVTVHEVGLDRKPLGGESSSSGVLAPVRDYRLLDLADEALGYALKDAAPPPPQSSM